MFNKKIFNKILKLILITILIVSIFGCASKKQDILKQVSTPYKETKFTLNPDDRYKILINKDINAIIALKDSDGLVYKDITYFDVYTRPMRINYDDGYFIVIPEGWQKLYVDTTGIYLNYIPIK
ncbi:hypothetical protein DEFDS_P011 (plasmid) [Deferribacter desulfuricans SSM1]|uniref:Lipoprotein n=1 Tax=Deferribacter desulfuricans (strain DSM 14783 / JCM 11476 / NBRC 101012 / SSM1) TaxID=639282 RepID=D3PEJ7_DEFDS|nr:hypothetical protein [Deferribacter desulfuricans]BAI81639.1 hypothetical protein DEFDS_P011 [Deferribacter desulfuricans SSM1]